MAICLNGQELRIKKGIVVDSVSILDTIPESFSLFLPTHFEQKGQWPLLVVLDHRGRGKQSVAPFKKHAEEQGYLVASPNHINDTLPLTENMLRLGRVLQSLDSMFPIHNERVYMAGFDQGARLANLTPFVFKSIAGVISCGATLNNTELLTKKNPFHFIGIAGNEDFTYTELLSTEKYLNTLKFDNNILVFEGGKIWPPDKLLGKAMHYFTLRAMARGFVKIDDSYINRVFNEDIAIVATLIDQNKNLLAYRGLKEIQNAFRDLIPVDSIELVQKELRKSKDYRIQKRAGDAARFQELFLRDDYVFALEDDLATFNYKNLGWWNYQMGELDKIISGGGASKIQMGKRLVGFVNAIVEDDLDMVKAQKQVDDEALIFLSMLKTITDPREYGYYLDVVSLSAKYEDFGTALFYLEEAFKNGFTATEELNTIEHTALLRISPAYKKLVDTYQTKMPRTVKE